MRATRRGWPVTFFHMDGREDSGHETHPMNKSAQSALRVFKIKFSYLLESKVDDGGERYCSNWGVTKILALRHIYISLASQATPLAVIFWSGRYSTGD